MTTNSQERIINRATAVARKIAEQTHRPGTYRLQAAWKPPTRGFTTAVEDYTIWAEDRETNAEIFSLSIARIGSHGAFSGIKTRLVPNPSSVLPESVRRAGATIAVWDALNTPALRELS